MTAKHIFSRRLWKEDHNKLFDTDTLSGFIKNVLKYSNRTNKECMLGEYPDITENDFKGYSFELLVEYLINSVGHPIIPIINYTPTIVDDWGIDGLGEIQLKSSVLKCSIQCKFKSDPTNLLMYNEDHLGNFIADSVINKVELQHINDYHKDNIKILPTLYIFTTANGLDYTVENYFKKKLLQVHTYGYDDIAKLIDYNYSFWKSIKI